MYFALKKARIFGIGGKGAQQRQCNGYLLGYITEPSRSCKYYAVQNGIVCFNILGQFVSTLNS